VSKWDPADDWRELAVCRESDPEIWFPLRSETVTRTGATKLAKQICGRCTVSVQCLDFAITNREEHGVWGGQDINRYRSGLAS
jgi:WhiB family redox-sensing transcriptional regulator